MSQPIILLVLLFYNVAANPVTRIDPLVETKLGRIRGLNSDDGSYSKFLGIPYALVDEEQPFAPSMPHPSFNDTFNAFNGSIECPQMVIQAVGQIQCLTLSIYVPNATSRRGPLPVMIYIHGGGFVLGSGGYNGPPEKLIEKEVIVVLINYRLAAYGFFCTESRKAPGNVGLKDQLRALRWIKDNIDAFGGDPNEITVFGESAGGMSIHLHLLSPHEQLFNRAMIQSGPATCPRTVTSKPNDSPIKVSSALGFQTDNVDEALDFLARVDSNLVVATAMNILGNYFNEITMIPCIEKEMEGLERFVTGNPNTMTSEKMKNLTILIGYTSQEMIYEYGLRDEHYFDSYSFGELIESGFNVDDEAVDIVRQFYIGDNDPSVKLVNEITSAGSDFIFNYPTEKGLQKMMEVKPKAVYYYVFSYEGEGDYSAFIPLDIDGVPHTSEMLYLFSNAINVTIHREIIDQMTTMWTNFVKYGDPTPEISNLLPVKWEPVTEESRPYLSIDKNLTLKHRPFHDRMAFWDLFYELYDDNATWNNI